ncbi:Sorbose reductase sou1 [Recurvomyces mirabilis]|uniref:NADP-dependent mannitol dehydrogenase n=1 Tax=Recurvomyces mirabilis TaxID=574656 RepID=A0AAE0WXH4_9PEZI|nr:Sorbose reductase sou1 [Recurvomyces mirabilis]KAK5161744.1 Sorbose reductase sou1 [Recurvomyces mirabilis]
MVMVRAEKQAPEDSSMKNGVFRQYNTKAPKETQVLPLFSLKHKTAIVSGSGAGIGLQVVHAFAEAGANVAIWYHGNKEALDRAAEVEKKYGTDVTDYENVKKVMNEIAEDFNGRLDIFVANAGIPWTQGRMIDGELSHYHRVVATDLDSVFYSAKAAGEIFRKQYENGGVSLTGEALQNYSYGSFIATSSMSGHVANIPQLQSAYNAAKAGVRHLCQSLAVEWVKFARVNSISPGYMATEISNFVPPETKAIWRGKIPMGREGEAHELKGAYLYLASDASSYTTGTDITVDGGYCAV